MSSSSSGISSTRKKNGSKKNVLLTSLLQNYRLGAAHARVHVYGFATCINIFVPSGDVWPIKCEFTHHCRAHTDHQTFIGLLRTSTSDPFTWQDPDATSDISKFWETDPSSSSRLCAKLNYVFIEGSNCQSLSYVCKVAAIGKTLR